MAAKRLWLSQLKKHTFHNIMQACEKIVKEQPYLPTLSTVITYCDANLNSQMPDAYQAYIEACRASSPKAQFNWSHPAIYYAGLASDWFFLANTEEKQAFPVFKNNYEILLKRVNAGENLNIKLPKALEENPTQKASPQAAKAQFDKIKAALNKT